MVGGLLALLFCDLLRCCLGGVVGDLLLLVIWNLVCLWVYLVFRCLMCLV